MKTASMELPIEVVYSHFSGILLKNCYYLDNLGEGSHEFYKFQELPEICEFYLISDFYHEGKAWKGMFKFTGNSSKKVF